MLVVVAIALAAVLIAAFVFLQLGRSEGHAGRSKDAHGTTRQSKATAGVAKAKGVAPAARTAAETIATRSSGGPGASTSGDRPADPRFAGVELRVGNPACKAARRLAGKIFLMHEAPILPLGRCDAARCRCSFEKRADRREESRRWEDHGVQATITSAVERRRGRDRRGSGRTG